MEQMESGKEYIQNIQSNEGSTKPVKDEHLITQFNNESNSEKLNQIEQLNKQINKDLQNQDQLSDDDENENQHSQQMSHLNDIIVKNKRRTREESSQDRNYTCGCGKSYLSYPALYLHLKNKHNGKPPSGTLLPSNQFKKKKNQNVEKNDNVDDFVCLEDFIKFLKNLDSSYVNEYKRDINDENTVNLLKMSYFMINERDNTMKNTFNQFLDDKYLLKQVRTIKQNDNSLEVNQTSINQVFSYFLVHLSKVVSIKIFEEFTFFFEAFRQVINMEGWVIFKAAEGNQNVDEFSSLNGCEAILELANCFVSQHFLNILSRYEYGKFSLFGPTLIQVKYAIHIIQIFSNWLYNNRFTNSKLIISNDAETMS